MASKNTGAGLLLLTIGFFIGVIYPFLLFTLPPEKAIRLLLLTVGTVSIALGALLGSIGVLLLRGIKVEEDDNTNAE